jgi:replicative DNA helicase
MELNYSENIILRNVIANPSYLEVCNPEFFAQTAYQLTLKIVKIFHGKYSQVPTASQVKEAVKIGKKEKEITEGEIDAIYAIDLGSYAQDWLQEITEVFIEYKNLTKSAVDAVQYIQTTPVSAENIKSVVEQFKSIINERNTIDFGFDEGLDFFEATNHKQLTFNTFSSGYPFIDTVLGGGFSAKSLYVFMGMPKVGKSLWLGNLAVSAVKNGHNVAILSFEMNDRKYIKRLGSNMLGIPISDYKNVAEQEESIKKRLQTISFDNLRIPGKFHIKEFPTSQAGVPEVERYLKKLEEKKGIKFKMVIIDYINIMKNWRNANSENTYMKIKQIAEDLRGMAMSNNWSIITATQTKSCLTPDTELISKNRGIITLGELEEGEMIRGKNTWVKVLKKWEPEVQKVYEIELWCGKTIKASANHRFPVLGYHQQEGYELYETSKLIVGQHLFVSEGDTSKIESITILDEEMETIDITVDSKDRLFYANQILTHNSEFDSTDLSINSAAESSGLVATVDGMFGIIQDPIMYANREYKLKILANREEGYKNAYKNFRVDYTYMRIIEDSNTEMHTE